METLIKMVVWLTDHSLHRHGEPASLHTPEHPPHRLFDPVAMLGLGGLSYRAPWDALQ